MNPKDLQPEIDKLSEEIKSMSEKLELLNRSYSLHRHLGVRTDGSPRFEGAADGDFTSVSISGGASAGNGLTKIPLVVYDSTSAPENAGVSGTSIVRRFSAFGVQTNLPTTSAENIHGLLGVGIDNKEPVTVKDSTDFNNVTTGTLDLYYNPSSPASIPWGGLRGFVTPFISRESAATGAITNGGSTLTDSALDIRPTNVLAGRIISILDSNGVLLESFVIASNTATVITISGTWTQATGSYRFVVYSPILLGDAGFPWQRLYVGGYDTKDIRLGYGASGGTQVLWICHGSGSPEGVVTANVGSLYLRTDGSTSTTLYVKTSGTGNTGWTNK